MASRILAARLQPFVGQQRGGLARLFSAEAVKAPSASEGFKTTTLDNGVVVASDDNGAAFGTVSVVVAAGSRYEEPVQKGISQYLTTLAFKSATETRTPLGIVRSTEAVGATLSTACNPEFLVFSGRYLRDDVSLVANTVADAVTGAKYNGWEVQGADSLVRGLVAGRSDASVLSDATHYGAFQRGLGNSISCSPYKIGGFSQEDLISYRDSVFSGHRVVVIGSGCSHDELVNAVAEPMSSIAAGEFPKTESKFIGDFESHIETASSRVTAQFGFPGVAANSSSAPAVAVLAKLVGGTEGSIKWSSGLASSRTHAAVQATTQSFSLGSFLHAYSDAGIFGFTLTTDSVGAKNAIQAASAAAKDTFAGHFTDEDLARAKNQAATAVLKCSNTTELIRTGAQLITTGKLTTPAEIAQAIQNVSAEDVKKAGKVALAAKPVYSVLGNISEAPFASDL